VPLIYLPVGLLDVSQAGLELAFGIAGTLLFSQCNMAQRGFVLTVFQGVEALIPLGAFFLPSVAPVSQQDF
jgi:hypothetical protein